jgi:hypothetical protein
VKVGLGLGAKVGRGVGVKVGAGVGETVGLAVGLGLGAKVGLGLGENVGLGVGAKVGLGVGAKVGAGEGLAVGAAVGMSEHPIWPVNPDVHVVVRQSWHRWYFFLSWYLPAGQWKQLVWPVHGEYEPSSHGLQALPVVAWYWPAWQAVQETEPAMA